MVVTDKKLARALCVFDNNNKRIAIEVCDLLIERFKKWEGKCYNKRIKEDLEWFVVNNLKENDNGLEQYEKNRIRFCTSAWNDGYIDVKFLSLNNYGRSRRRWRV